MALHRPIQTRFRSASGAERLRHAPPEQLPDSLNKRHHVTRLRTSPLLWPAGGEAGPQEPEAELCEGELRVFVGTWFQIFSLPLRGAFHLSLALLSSLSVSEEYLALCDGPHRFTPVFPWQALLGMLPKGTDCLSPTGLSPSMADRSRSFG